MQPVDALTEADKASATGAADIAEAAHWLTHPDAPARRKTFADLLDQWESEPEWNEQEPSCPEDE
jgi:hypothetical protein